MPTPGDDTAADELVLFAVNDEPSYRHAQAIMRNMVAKMNRGTYDAKLAIKAWEHWAIGAAKRYEKEFMRPGDATRIFPPATRRLAAEEAVRYYAEEMEGMRSPRAPRRRR